LGDAQAAHGLFAALAAEATEMVALAYLDADQRVLGMRHLHSRAHDRLELPIRLIAADALAFDAAALVMAHNHPSGDPTPSRADRDATAQLARTLELLGVRLLDHLVIARNGVASFRSLGLL
jgi:DNA repair protein RadC